MDSPCAPFERWIAERAAGELDASSERLLASHLAFCSRCRAEAAATERAMDFAALPPPAPAEMAALSNLGERTRVAYARSQTRRAWRRGASIGALAAVFAGAMLIPLWAAQEPSPPPVARPPAQIRRQAAPVAVRAQNRPVVTPADIEAAWAASAEMGWPAFDDEWRGARRAPLFEVRTVGLETDFRLGD